MKCYYCKQALKSESNTKHGLHSNCFNKWFDIASSAKDFKNISLKQGSQNTSMEQENINKMNTSFFHGAFKKYSAEIGENQYILKMEQTDYPELPKIEWISNLIFKDLGINTAEFYLINFANVQSTFVTKNFMAKKSGANLIHIYHFIDPASQQYNCEELIKIIFSKCGTLRDVKTFIETVLADSLIGNHDRHGRNLALIQKGPENYELSPIYDNPSAIGIEADYLLGADLNPKGKIWTSVSKEPTLIDYINEFRKLGHEEVTNDFINKIDQKWDQIIVNIKDSDLTEKRKIAFINILKKRKSELTV